MTRNTDAVPRHYYWWTLQAWCRSVPDRLAWRLAWWLPRRIALFAFVRVYGAWGDCGPDYAAVYDAWEAGTRPRE